MLSLKQPQPQSVKKTPMHKPMHNQDIIDALQMLNKLLDEEAHQGYDPDDRELWARVGNRIDKIDYIDSAKIEIPAINPGPSHTPPRLELVPPEPATKPTTLASKVAQTINTKLSKFGLDRLNKQQQSELTTSLLKLFEKK